MRKALPYVGLIVVAAGLVGLVVLLQSMGGGGPTRPDPLAPDELVTDLKILPFALTDQAGNPVDESMLVGKITVMDFIFTHCPTVCPVLTGSMSRLSEAVRDPRVQYLSVSVDEVNDTPETLKAYGERHNADFRRWKFLSGERETTWAMVGEGLMFAIEDDDSFMIDVGDGVQMQNILHPGWHVLIGPDTRVLGIYRSNSDAQNEALKLRIRLMLDAMDEAGA